MARLSRVTVPGLAHHVTQRGNCQQDVFFKPDDYALYLDLIAEHCEQQGVDVWSYCLLPNQVNLILVPEDEEGLARAIGEAHRRYSSYINARRRVTGHLFQGRFGSVAMDETHLLAAFRYLAMIPVRQQLVDRPEQWEWSSTLAHLAGVNDVLVNVRPFLDRVNDVSQFLRAQAVPRLEQALMSGQSVGRPLMSNTDLAALEQQLDRRLRPAKRGRPPKN